MSARALLIAGTRPELIKLAPLMRALSDDARFDAQLALTGQHPSLTHGLLDWFELRPEHRLSAGHDHPDLTTLLARMVAQLGALIRQDAPEVVIVQGDTTSALAGALAAYYQGVPVAHLEAGLRTDHAQQPWPEEANRRMISTLTRWHMAPTPSAQARLIQEGHAPERVAMTGNTVIDALRWSCARLDAMSDETRQSLATGASWLDALAHSQGASSPTLEAPLVLVTAHRRETFIGGGGASLANALRMLAQDAPQARFALPLHPSPEVTQALTHALHDLPNVWLLEPLPYPAFIALLRRAALALTDSGGVQEEAPWLGVPTLVMREVTERVEPIQQHTSALIGTRASSIARLAGALLRDPVRHAAMRARIAPFGEGDAAPRARDALARWMGLGPAVSAT